MDIKYIKSIFYMINRPPDQISDVLDDKGPLQQQKTVVYLQKELKKGLLLTLRYSIKIMTTY